MQKRKNGKTKQAWRTGKGLEAKKPYFHSDSPFFPIAHNPDEILASYRTRLQPGHPGPRVDFAFPPNYNRGMDHALPV